MNKYNKSTLMGYKKDYLADLVLMEAHNVGVMEETLNQQAENVKDWQPVIHGLWKKIPNYNVWLCSNCHEDVVDDLRRRKSVEGMTFRFCPYCGAKNNLDIEKTIEENKYTVDWNNVAVDTPIQVLVSKYDDVWENAHFAKYEDGKVFFWEDGMTSWTTEETTWRYEQLVKLIVERKDVR